MKKRLLSVALSVIWLAGTGAAEVVTDTEADAPRQAAASVYKFKEGGIQFTLPAGWEARPDPEGAVKVGPKTGGNAQIAFIALPVAADLNADDKASLFDTLVEKSKSADWQLGEYKDNETMGGMRLALRPYESKNNVHGMFFLLSANKLVFIVLAINKAAPATVNSDAETVINTVKKIE